MVTLRNLRRLAGMALSYESMCNNGSIVLVYEFVITNLHIVKFTSTAFFSKSIRRRNPTLTDNKPRILKTIGSNLYGKRRSIYSTQFSEEKMQTNVLIRVPCRLFSKKIPTKFSAVGVLSTRLTEFIRTSKKSV
jgi:hypothetical protein